ncbi:MAG: ABC transporter substrate-binding protein [Microbacterium sp.]
MIDKVSAGFLNRRQAGKLLLGTAGLLMVPNILRAQAAAPREGGTLIISLLNTLPSLHTMLRTTGNSWLITPNLYNTLTTLTADGLVRPELAESWEVNDALTEWTFRLRKGVKFHSGAPLTSADVKATFDKLLDPVLVNKEARNIGPIETVTALDDHTVLFKLSSPYAELHRQLAFSITKIIGVEAMDDFDALDYKVAGTGPFILKSFTPNVEVVMERNPDYFLGPVLLERVIFRILPDATSQVAALTNREIDLIAEVTGDTYRRAKTIPGVEVLIAGGGTIYPVRMLRAEPPFDDIRVRRAFSLCMDRAGIVQALTDGTGTPGDDQPLSQIYEFYSPGSGVPPFDLDEARRLMKEAGYGGGASAVFRVTAEGADRRSQTELMLAMAAEIGLHLEMEMMDSVVFNQLYYGKNNSNNIGWYGARASADTMLTLMLHSKLGVNDTAWATPETDRMLDEARASGDPAFRGRIYAELQQRLRDEVPMIIPAFYRKMAVHNDYVQAVPFAGNQWDMRFDKTWFTDQAPSRS